MIKERHKSIKNYKGIYQVSIFGYIRSLSRIRKNGIISKYKYKGRFLKSSIDGRGYSTVKLYKNGRGKTHRVHLLVLPTFKKKPSKNHECNHKDGDKQNNELSNLEWVTSSENTHHSFKNGLQEGYKMPSNKEIKEIQKLHIPYKVSMSFLARKYGVGHTTIWRIINNKITKRDF